MFKITKERSFIAEMECSLLAQHFYLLTKDIIMDLVKGEDPLPPIASIGHFFNSGERSIIGNSRWDDETIKLLYRLCKDVYPDGALESSPMETLKRVCVDTHDQFEKIVKVTRLYPGRADRYASAGVEYTSRMVQKIEDLLYNEDNCVTPINEPAVDDLERNEPARKSESNIDKQTILDFVNGFKKIGRAE